MAEPSTFDRALNSLRPLVPARFRCDIPIVPVVRLAGVIGFSTPLKPGLTLASVARALDRAFAMRNIARGGAVDQLARRLGRAVAPDLPAHPRAGRREEASCHRLRRGRRGLGRLYDRLRRRRDRLRPVLDRRLDRRGRRLVRLRQADPEDRRRAAAVYLGRTQGDARPVPAGEARRRRAAQGDPERDPRNVSSRWSRRAAATSSTAAKPPCSPENIGPVSAASSLASSTRLEICGASCANASATSCGCRWSPSAARSGDGCLEWRKAAPSCWRTVRTSPRIWFRRSKPARSGRVTDYRRRPCRCCHP